MKIMCFLKRKPGMSMADFKAYYENHHARLAERLLPFYKEYRRNFRAEVQDYEPAHLENKVAAEPDFDVVTELTFASKAKYEQLVAALGDPAIGDVIAKDEENLFDRSKMTIYIMEEYKSADLAA